MKTESILLAPRRSGSRFPPLPRRPRQAQPDQLKEERAYAVDNLEAGKLAGA
jgi:hypothetical protein